MQIIVGISGATGSIYGIRLLEVLKQMKVETHLIISSAAKQIIPGETRYTVAQVEEMASFVHDNDNLAAPISSGSFKTDGMIVAPCSIKSLSGIAHSYNDNLLTRAADVTLKERRRLVLTVRETPLHQGHLDLMLKATNIGAIIYPPVPAFYSNPVSINDLVNHTVGKLLDLFSIDAKLFRRWGGTPPYVSQESNDFV
ncbi:MAG: UbiX family flavin prenyltransferase [Syntrophobacterales bacterium]|jgi:4-hydroxy-3-polyprenylbenzoate decarboxylase|nr:UbiX family flavin prenyltransferase [Syntrophobacterales bacterium]